jgi:hypothetical protein
MAIEDLNQNYNPQGALGGLFAPAYVHGYAPSNAAVTDWMGQNRAVTPAMIDESRMPSVWTPPEDPYTSMRRGGGGKGAGMYGEGRVPDSITFGDQRGPVDPEVLRAASQGGPYDIGARREAIAARLLENQGLQDAFYKPKIDPYGMGGMYGGYSAPSFYDGGG